TKFSIASVHLGKYEGRRKPLIRCAGNEQVAEVICDWPVAGIEAGHPGLQVSRGPSCGLPKHHIALTPPREFWRPGPDQEGQSDHTKGCRAEWVPLHFPQDPPDVSLHKWRRYRWQPVENSIQLKGQLS